MDRLEAARGRLRSEVAAGITRKRAPQLVFDVVGFDGDGSAEVRR
jgi:hypothetical protein